MLVFVTVREGNKYRRSMGNEVFRKKSKIEGILLFEKPSLKNITYFSFKNT